MKYSLKSLMIVVILAPPILATAWMLASTAIQHLNRGTEEQWEEIEGPGAVATFETYLHSDSSGSDSRGENGGRGSLP
jgi:hypothetical protein